MKRKNILLILMLALMALGAPLSGWAQTTHPWGSSSDYSSTSTYANPFGRYYGYEYRIFLYAPNTMNGVTGYITNLEFLPSGTLNSNGGQIDVWMKSVTDITSLSSSTSFATYKSGATKVYTSSSSPSYSSGSYVSIPLSSSIAYNYSNNEYLMILVRSVASDPSSGDASTSFYIKTLLMPATTLGMPKKMGQTQGKTLFLLLIGVLLVPEPIFPLFE